MSNYDFLKILMFVMVFAIALPILQVNQRIYSERKSLNKAIYA